MANPRIVIPANYAANLELLRNRRTFADRSVARSTEWTVERWDAIPDYNRNPMTIDALYQWHQSEHAIETEEDVALLFQVASQIFDYGCEGNAPDVGGDVVVAGRQNRHILYLASATALVFLRRWCRQASTVENGLVKIPEVLGLPHIETNRVLGDSAVVNIKRYPHRQAFLKAAILTGLTEDEDLKKLISFTFLFHTQYAELTLAKMLLRLADNLHCSYARVTELVDIGDYAQIASRVFALAVGGNVDGAAVPAMPGFPWCRLFDSSAHVNLSAKTHPAFVTMLLAANLQAQGITEVPHLMSVGINMASPHWRQGIGIGNTVHQLPDRRGGAVPAAEANPEMHFRANRPNVVNF